MLLSVSYLKVFLGLDITCLKFKDAKSNETYSFDYLTTATSNGDGENKTAEATVELSDSQNLVHNVILRNCSGNM